jgi:hypothetical protein
MKSIFVLSLLALASSLPAYAQSKGGGGGGTTTPVGVITIDQAKAEAGGITPGDAPGFPVTISQPGSYRLMGNLTVSDVNATAIAITANDVTLDLNGFAIVGPQDCGYTGAPTCTQGSGDGIYIDQPSNRWANIAIQNGTVRGMGRYGVYDGGGIRPGILIDRVRAVHNGGTGFGVSAALIVHSIALRNRLNGFSLNGGNVQSSLAWGNGSYGIIGTPGTTYGNSAFVGNTAGNAYSTMHQTAGNLCGAQACP